MKEINYGRVPQPKPDCTNIPIILSDETMQYRYQKVLKGMQEENFDTLVIYADLEHGSNFEYLCGFLPRFEEALLVMHQDGCNYMLMGNENLNKVEHARINAEAIHVPHFSLPNQPMDNKASFGELLKAAKIESGKKVGIVGWKNFTSKYDDNHNLFDVPYYIVQEIKALAGGSEYVTNAAYLFIGEKGVRCINNVNELEHYEFGASLASDRMLEAMQRLNEGVSEMSIGDALNAYGQRNSVVTIAAAGKRFIKANLYPTQNQVEIGDPISLTVGYKGGLSSRAGYAVHDAEELPAAAQNYLEAVVKPYYSAVVAWLENVHCGSSGNDVYQLVENVLPKDQYHWHLCPGHLTADEEWLASPIYENSQEVIESGMLFQIDIIPSVAGYAGTSCECSVALADEHLRENIKNTAPQFWQRIQARRKYIIEELNISLHPDILPMSSTVAYLRPYLLNKDKAMLVSR